MVDQADLVHQIVIGSVIPLSRRPNITKRGLRSLEDLVALREAQMGLFLIGPLFSISLSLWALVRRFNLCIADHFRQGGGQPHSVRADFSQQLDELLPNFLVIEVPIGQRKSRDFSIFVVVGEVVGKVP